MADIVDLAQEQMEQLDSVRRADLRPVAEATGLCLYCGEPLTPPVAANGIARRWCDAHCATDWQKYLKD